MKELPGEVWLLVAEHLDCISLARFSQACTAFRCMSRRSALWKDHFVGILEDIQHDMQRLHDSSVDYRLEFYHQKDIDRQTLSGMDDRYLKHGIRSRPALYKLCERSQLALTWLQAIKHVQAVTCFKDAITRFDYIQIMTTLDSFYWDEPDSPSNMFKSMSRPNIDTTQRVVPQLARHMVEKRYAPAAHQAPQLHTSNDELQSLGHGARSFISTLLIDGCFANDMVIVAVLMKLCDECHLEAYPFALPDGSIAIVVKENERFYIVEPYRVHCMYTVDHSLLPRPLAASQLATRVQNEIRSFDSPIKVKSSRLLGLEVLRAILTGQKLSSGVVERLKDGIGYLGQISRAVEDDNYDMDSPIVSDYSLSGGGPDLDSSKSRVRWYRGERTSRYR